MHQRVAGARPFAGLDVDLGDDAAHRRGDAAQLQLQLRGVEFGGLAFLLGHQLLVLGLLGEPVGARVQQLLLRDRAGLVEHLGLLVVQLLEDLGALLLGVERRAVVHDDLALLQLDGLLAVVDHQQHLLSLHGLAQLRVLGQHHAADARAQRQVVHRVDDAADFGRARGGRAQAARDRKRGQDDFGRLKHQLSRWML